MYCEYCKKDTTHISTPSTETCVVCGWVEYKLDRHQDINNYKCDECGELVQRDSNNKEIKSYCGRKDKMAKLIKQ